MFAQIAVFANCGIGHTIVFAAQDVPVEEGLGVLVFSVSEGGQETNEACYVLAGLRCCGSSGRSA